MALLHHLPVLSGEQAVTLEEGQEIVGTRSVTAASGTSWRKLFPESNKLCKQQSRGKETREETGEQWRRGCDTTAGLIGLGGNPKVCCTGIRAWLSKIHWPKTRPSSHSDLSHAAAHVVYLYFSCRISSSLNCTQHVCVSLSLWTCIGCYFELDHSFIQAFKPADISINLLLDNGPCSRFTSRKKIIEWGEKSIAYLNNPLPVTLGPLNRFVKPSYWYWYWQEIVG